MGISLGLQFNLERFAVFTAASFHFFIVFQISQ